MCHLFQLSSPEQALFVREIERNESSLTKSDDLDLYVVDCFFVKTLQRLDSEISAVYPALL